MNANSYASRRDKLTVYFDQTAAAAWQALTSDAPVNRVRRTVRAGRDAMRTQLLDWLPDDLAGRRILDAGCGTGAFAFEAAARGADVVAIDVAESLIDVARRRCPDDRTAQRIRFLVGDMCDPALGEFDHVVAMDSLIHYNRVDIAGSLQKLCERTRHSVLFTVAPRTPLLTLMHLAGRMIPHASNRAPAIVPVPPKWLARELNSRLGDNGWRCAASHRVNSAFYISEAMELRRG